MGACDMRKFSFGTDSPASVICERSEYASSRRVFSRREISLRWISEQNQCFGYVSSVCQAKEGERQRSTPPQEPPIGRAASIRTCCSARKRCGAQKARAKRTQRSSMV